MHGTPDDLAFWLQQLPLKDNPAFVATAGNAPDMETWLEAGREMPMIETRLISILEDDREPLTRSAAALALGFLGGKASTAPLISALRGDQPVVATEAALALGKLKDPEAVAPLCDALEHTDANIRATACTALGMLGGEPARACLRSALNDQDALVRDAARAALDNLGSGRQGHA